MLAVPFPRVDTNAHIKVVCGGFAAADTSYVIIRADSPLKTAFFILLAIHVIGAERAE